MDETTHLLSPKVLDRVLSFGDAWLPNWDGGPVLDRIAELFGDAARARPYLHGQFLTLRLTSAMYHRFHAPCNGTLKRVRYFSGDTWNVNPIALKRVEKLFCKNERALLETEIGPQAYPVALVPVAAVLVASIRLHALDGLLRTLCKGRNVVMCDHAFVKGQELGWFQHGSTILIFAPPSFWFIDGIREGLPIKIGQGLMHLPQASGSS